MHFQELNRAFFHKFILSDTVISTLQPLYFLVFQ